MIVPLVFAIIDFKLREIFMRYLVTCLVVCSSPALAEPHVMTTNFALLPCVETLNYIENPVMTPEGIGNMGMAFGYLLGFQAANGDDLSGERETVLQRILADCAERPGETAFNLLKGYIQ